MAVAEEENSLLINNGQVSDDYTQLTDTNGVPEEPKHRAFAISDIPLGVWLIISVEIFERFSYYSLRALLVFFLEERLGFSESKAKALSSYFSSCAYFMPIFGSLLADAFLGRFFAILVCTVIYTIGTYTLVLASYKESELYTYAALLMIAVGTGAIKPNINTFGASTLRTDNPSAIATYFAMFYASINLGSVCATLVLPKIQKSYGYTTAFMFPAVGLSLVLLIFISGYKLYNHIPPSSSLYRRIFDITLGARRGKKYVLESSPDPLIVDKIITSKRSRSQNLDPSNDYNDDVRLLDGKLLSSNERDEQQNEQQNEHDDVIDRKPSFLDYAKFYFRPEHVEQLHAVLNVLPVLPFMIAFFMCFGQTSSTFAIQAKKMDRVVLGFTILAPQVTALNAISILILVPTFDRIIYPFLRKTCGLQLKHLNRVLVGLLFTMTSFCFSTYVEYIIEQGEPNSVSILWQLPQYLLISMAELLISVCGLEFVYSQSPKAFKSTLSSFWSLCSAFGDLISGLVFTFIKFKHPWQTSLFFAIFVLVDFIAFIPIAIFFNNKTKKYYDNLHQEFLNPGSTPPPPVEPDYPFKPLTEEERAKLLEQGSF